MSVRSLLPAFALALAPASGLAASSPAVFVQEIYQPYRGTGEPDAGSERAIWSARTRALIARWRAVTPEDEIDDLSDSDWLCECQDWDARVFRAKLGTLRSLDTKRMQVTVDVTIAAGVVRHQRLELVREGGRWLLDDLFAADFPKGLRAALVATIAKDTHR